MANFSRKIFVRVWRRLRNSVRLLHIVFPLAYSDSGMYRRQTARSAQPRLHSDPDSRKTRYCYAIRSRVTSFIWFSRIEEHGHNSLVSSSLFHLHAENLTCRCFYKWTTLKRMLDNYVELSCNDSEKHLSFIKKQNGNLSKSGINISLLLYIYHIKLCLNNREFEDSEIEVSLAIRFMAT